MSSFSSVTTNAARMQEISLNPQKLAGQCSKLKCCLMYEYDAYADARRTIPRLREPLQTLEGEWFLVKVDPLAQTMSFSTSKGTMANLTTLPVSRVKELIALNRAGQKADTLVGEGGEAQVEEPTYRHEEDSITRFDSKNKRNKRNKRRGGRDRKAEGQPREQKEQKEPKEQPEPKAERVEKAEGAQQPRENKPREQREGQPREGQQRDGQRRNNRNNRFRGNRNRQNERQNDRGVENKE
jgi:hypothetical protein